MVGEAASRAACLASKENTMDSAYLRTLATQMEAAAKAFRQLADAQDAMQPLAQCVDAESVATDDDRNILKEPVSVLFFGRSGVNRILKAFNKHCIRTVEDLTQKSQWDIWGIRNLGVGSVNVVIDALSSVGLKLKDEPEEAYLRRRARELLASS